MPGPSPNPAANSSTLNATEFASAVTAITSAFGDPTRSEIYLFAHEHPEGITAAEAADHFELHANVARHHLDKLAAGGHLEVTVEQVIGEGDLVSSYLRYTGTQEGDFEEEQDIPVTGLSTEWVGMAHFRIECGKIAEIWSVADDLGRLQRLGVITDEELESVEPVATPAP